jgi:ribosomal-protein-alanine N-acetyltransferase
LTAPAAGHRLRTASGDDLARLHEIERSAHTHPWSEEQLRRELGNAYSRILGAELTDGGEGGPGRLAGFIVYWVIHDEMHILDVVTAQEARRRGLARALMVAAMEDARGRGAGRAMLEVRRSNAPAIALYRALGFLHDTVRRGYYQDGEDAVLMSLALAR